jgi:hypothetical protein
VWVATSDPLPIVFGLAGSARAGERTRPRVLYTGTYRQLRFEWSGDFCNQHLHPNSNPQESTCLFSRFRSIPIRGRRFFWPALFCSGGLGRMRESDGCLAPRRGAEPPPPPHVVPAPLRAPGGGRALRASRWLYPHPRASTPRVDSDPASPEGCVLGPSLREASPSPWAAGASASASVGSASTGLLPSLLP